jgi:hypothetical protein
MKMLTPEELERAAPSMASFKLGHGKEAKRGTGIVIESNDRFTVVKLSDGNIIRRWNNFHDVQIYPRGVILKGQFSL